MLSPAARRSLIFVVLMSVGLTVVLSVEDEDPVPLRQPGYRELEPPAPGGVTLHDGESDTETQVSLTEIVTALYSTVELPDGRLERRKTYRIHILGGTMDASGGILVDSPHITLLDPFTGEDRGSVRADKGHVRGNDDGPAFGVFDLSSMDVREITLTGNVHGEMELEGDEVPATFDGPELRVSGQNLSAPGNVHLASATLTVTGADMSWDDTSRELRFAHISEIEFIGELGAVVQSPEGLVWFAGDGVDQLGHGTLFGPITGQATDGSRIAGRQLELDEASASLTLIGDARLDLPFEGAMWAATADTISARQTEAREWQLSYAEGDVRMASPDSDPPAWFETDRIDNVDETMVAEGRIHGQYGEFDIAATGLRWNEAEGQLDLLADVDIGFLAVDDTSTLAAARVSSPGGAFLSQDSDGIRARLAGPVEGTIPGLGSFECSVLTYDDALFEVILDGSADVEFVQSELTRQLTSDWVAVTLDALRAPSGVRARGHVVLTETNDDGLQARLASSELDVAGELASTPEPFELYWRGFHATGTGLTVDRDQGLFDIAHSARIERTLHAGGTEWLVAESGASWWLPDGTDPDPAAGHGEFRGPVTGQTADGISIEADTLEVDGARESAQLIGSAVITHATHGRFESERVEVSRGPGGFRARSPVLVTWTSEQISGHGTQLDYDQELGHLSLERDVLMRYTGEGGPTREIACSGQFTFNAPPGAVDPFEQGVAEFNENVVGKDGAGGGLSADRLLIDRPRKQVELFGECGLRHVREDTLYSLDTEPAGYIRLATDATGQPLQLIASGRLELSANEMTLQGDELDWDVAEDHVLLSGDCRLKIFGSWMSMPSVEAWPGVPRWYIPRNVSKYHADDP